MASKRWLFVWEVDSLARLFRDLKVNEEDGKVYLTLYNREGVPVLRDVSVQVSSEVVQPGDKWTAAAANLLLRLDEEGAPQLALTPEDIGAASVRDGVGLYTHRKSGTVHALTGSGDNIRFLATADFAAGDTFTVNGVPCTAKTLGGDSLWAGFFKTGAMVVCWKSEGGLTFNGGGLPAAELAKLVPANLKTGVSITANGKTVTGTFTADATATAAQILSGKTAYVKGAKVTGTIPSKSAASYRPGRTNQTIAAGQYLSGTQTIQGDANLLAANIRQGVTLFGVTGTGIMLQPDMPRGWVTVCEIWDGNVQPSTVPSIAYPQLVESVYIGWLDGDQGDNYGARIRDSGRQWRLVPVSIVQNNTTIRFRKNGIVLSQQSGSGNPSYTLGYLAGGDVITIGVDGNGSAQALYALQAYIA